METTQNADNLRFRLVLFLITVAAVGAVILPVLIPMLLGASSELTYVQYAHFTRASAFAAYILLWVSMLAGLSITSKAGRKWPGMSWSFGLHRYTTLLGLGFAAVHALVLLSDKFMGFTLFQLVVPFMGPYKTQWLGLGQVALYALSAVALSFYARKRLGIRTWRLIHSLSFALFLMALIHGLQSGGDSHTWWATGLYWVSATSVLAGSILRVIAARAGSPRAKLATSGLLVVGGKAQPRPRPAVLHPEPSAHRDVPQSGGSRAWISN